MSKQQQSKVQVSERALIQRINRKLQQQPNPESLRTARNDRQAEELGNYYVVETGIGGQARKAASSGIVYVHVDLEKLGHKLGVIQPWEALKRD